MSTFHLLNFGCRASQADGAGIKAKLLDAGFEETARVEDSQIAILNTCTVTAVADAEVRQTIRRIHRANPECKVLVTGCYAQRAPEEIARLEGVAWVVGNSHKHTISELLAGGAGTDAVSTRPGGLLFEIQGIPPAANGAATRVMVGEIAPEFHFVPASADDRSRPTLKVQDGCDARCAFCVIPAVRGSSRSLPPDRVLAEVRRLDAEGFPEIVLSGINLGRYGRDLTPRLTFLDLVERILAETSLRRLRISSLEPMDIGTPLIRLVASEPRIARHFHIPLQSGSDRILRRMNRRYWARQYAERVREIHERIPNAALGADVMVGFPGETANDHAASLRFIDSLPFTYLHIFPYSARPGTRSAGMAAPVPRSVAQGRGRELRGLIARKRAEFLAAQLGRALSVVTLDQSEGEARLALSSNYLKVALASSAQPPRRLLEVRIARAFGGILYGYPESPSLACP